MISLKYKILALVLGIPLILLIVFESVTLNYATQQLNESINSSVHTAEEFTIEKAGG